MTVVQAVIVAAQAAQAVNVAAPVVAVIVVMPLQQPRLLKPCQHPPRSKLSPPPIFSPY